MISNRYSVGEPAELEIQIDSFFTLCFSGLICSGFAKHYNACSARPFTVNMNTSELLESDWHCSIGHHRTLCHRDDWLLSVDKGSDSNVFGHFVPPIDELKNAVRSPIFFSLRASHSARRRCRADTRRHSPSSRSCTPMAADV